MTVKEFFLKEILELLMKIIHYD